MAHTFALSVGHASLGKEAWLRRMAESGICDFEYSNSPFPPVREVRAQIAGLRPYIEAGSIRFPSLHLPFGWNNEECPGQPEEFDRNLCMDRLGNLIDVFLPIGMKHLTMHVGRPVEGVSHEEGIPLAKLAIERILPTVEKYGLSLNIELCPRQAISHTPEDLEKLLDGMPECVGICFDVNHGDLRGREIPEWIARLGKRIRTFHISDCDGIDECHWMPGVGAMDWPAILHEIARLDHDCVLIWEVSMDGYKTPAFIGRDVDPVWFLRAVERNMAWVKTLLK